MTLKPASSPATSAVPVPYKNMNYSGLPGYYQAWPQIHHPITLPVDHVHESCKEIQSFPLQARTQPTLISSHCIKDALSQTRSMHKFQSNVRSLSWEGS